MAVARENDRSINSSRCSLGMPVSLCKQWYFFLQRASRVVDRGSHVRSSLRARTVPHSLQQSREREGWLDAGRRAIRGPSPVMMTREPFPEVDRSTGTHVRNPPDPPIHCTNAPATVRSFDLCVPHKLRQVCLAPPRAIDAAKILEPKRQRHIPSRRRRALETSRTQQWYLARLHMRIRHHVDRSV